MEKQKRTQLSALRTPPITMVPLCLAFLLKHGGSNGWLKELLLQVAVLFKYEMVYITFLNINN